LLAELLPGSTAQWLTPRARAGSPERTLHNDVGDSGSSHEEWDDDTRLKQPFGPDLKLAHVKLDQSNLCKSLANAAQIPVRRGGS
jgi:hypothetical protein